jgi:hypothetical protein
MRIWFLTVLVVALSSGCVMVNKSVLRDNPTGEVFAKEDVQVYFEDDTLPVHLRVAILTGKGHDEWTNEGQMVDKLREEAGKLGANAIVLKGIKDPGAGTKFVSALFGTSSNRKGEALAIFVPPPEPEMAPLTTAPRELRSVDYEDTEKSSVTSPAAFSETPFEETQKNENASASAPVPEIKEPMAKPETRLPYLRRAAPQLDKYTDEQIIRVYKKRHPGFENSSDEEVVEFLETKYRD